MHGYINRCASLVHGYRGSRHDLMKKIHNHVNNCSRAYDFRESFRCSVNYAGNTCWQLVSALMSSGYPNHARNWQQNSGIVEEQV